MNKFWVFSVLFLCLSSCVSVKKYNKHLEKPVAVEDLKKDVDFVEKKLKKYHPSLYWYVSEYQLSQKFDSIRSLIQQPMTPNEFYLLISLPIAEVKQAHTSVQPLLRKTTREEAKTFKTKGAGPFSQLKMLWYENDLYVLKNVSPDSTIIKGSKIVSFDGLSPNDLHQKYKNTFASDGFNQTWQPKKFNRSLPLFFTIEKGIKDSITYQLSYQDSLYTKTLKRVEKKAKNVKTNLNDSLKPAVEKLKTDNLVLNQKRDSLKIVMKNRNIFGYDNDLKIFAKDFKISKNDSSIAILKVTSFSKGQYHKAYKIIFDSIQKTNIQTLILDLRGNTGGSIEDARLLFGYLAKHPYQFIQKSKVTHRGSIPLSAYRNLPLLGSILMTPFKPIVSGVMFAKTSKDEVGNTYFKIRSENLKMPQENAFQGNLYVLIDGGSFSASCLLASNLKGAKRAFFVGEETGGTFNGTVAGFMPVFKLPNSKLNFKVGLMDIRPIYQTEIVGRGIFPDKSITPSLDDILNDRDVQLDWIFEDIKNNR